MKTIKTHKIILFLIVFAIGLFAASCEQPTGDQMQIQEEEPAPEVAASFDAMTRFPVFDTIARKCDDHPVYMTFVHIPGLSDIPVNEEGYEIYYYNWGVLNSGTSSHAGRGPGKEKLRLWPFVITKPIDKASPELRRFADSGASIGEAVLTLRMTCGEEEVETETLTIELEDVVITSYQISGSSDSSRRVPTEKITFITQRLHCYFRPSKRCAMQTGEFSFL